MLFRSLGMGAAHGPLMSTPPEQWDLRAKADRENKSHWFRGKAYDFEALLKERAPGFADQVALEVRKERHARCQAAPGSDAADALEPPSPGLFWITRPGENFASESILATPR